MASYSLGKKCKACGFRLLNSNMSGYCNHHRDRSGSNNSFFGKTHTKDAIDSIKKKCAAASTDKWTYDEYRNRVIKGVSKPRKEEFGKEQSARVKKWYEENPEQKILRRDTMRNSWKSGKIVANGYSCNKSKLQMSLLNDIKDLCSDDVNGKTIRLISGSYLFPDILIEEVGLVVEFYGDYWHANPRFYKENDIVHNGLSARQIWKYDEERIRKFDNVKNGKNVTAYNVYVVWEYDYKNNREGVLRKLDALINNEMCGG